MNWRFNKIKTLTPRQLKVSIKRTKAKERKAERTILQKARDFLIQQGIDPYLVMVDHCRLAPYLEKFTGSTEGRPDERYRAAVIKLIDAGHFSVSKYKVHVLIPVDNITTEISAVKSPREAKIFYDSYAWRKLRYEILLKYGRKCMCCGATEGMFHVDHIKPLRKYWGLRLDHNNMQVLCDVCNHGKGNWDQTDHRTV